MIVRRRGSVADLHAIDPFAEAVVAAPRLYWCDPTTRAIVLGSRQTPDVLDLEACARLGLDVVHRRSGGGAVLVVPPDLLWVDIVLPLGVAPDDVRGSMIWAGMRWRDALPARVLPVGVELAVHERPGPDTPWSSLVCFAGVGAGEVLLDGRKLVGLSQRRTRHGLRIQGLVHLRTPTIDVAGLFRPPIPIAPVPAPAVLGEVDVEELVEHLASSLTPTA